MKLTLAELAEKTATRLQGDGSAVVSRVASLDSEDAEAVSFLSDPAWLSRLPQTGVCAVVLHARHADACPVNALVSENPYADYARIARLLNPEPAVEPGIHPSAVVDPLASVHDTAWIGPRCVLDAGAVIGPGCFLGPGCVIGADVVLGSDVRLAANVTILQGSSLGDRCRVHPGAVIGSDGFGFANSDGQWLKIPQLGRVVIGEDVDIGANTSIDRGALEDTVIGDGVIIDNQVQIAHNVRIGDQSAIAGCAGIAGSCTLGKGVMIAGGAGLAGHLELADGVTITAMSLVTHSIREPGVYSSAFPARANGDWNRNVARFNKLRELSGRVKKLEKKN